MGLSHAAWLQELWDTDAKTEGWGPLGRRTLVLAGLRGLADKSTRPALRVATACSVDGVACSCGHPTPGRRHLTFECNAESGAVLARATELEERLLCRLVDLPQPPPCRDEVEGYEDELLSEMEAAAQTGDTLFAATDGGCLVKPGMELWQRGAWAITLRRRSTTTTVSGRLEGGEQTPAAAEREAIHQLLKHVRRARCKLILFVDNQAAVRRLRRAWEKGQWHGLLALFWRRVAEGLSDHVTVHWVPSHNKRPQWSSPSEMITTKEVRELNMLADRACTAQLAALRPSWENACSVVEGAASWSRAAAQLQMERTVSFNE